MIPLELRAYPLYERPQVDKSSHFRRHQFGSERDDFETSTKKTPERREQLKLVGRIIDFSRALEVPWRRMTNWLVEKNAAPFIQNIHQYITPVDTNSAEFIRRSIDVARIYSDFQTIETEINTESGRLDAITDSDEACVFIMNHDFQAQDPTLLSQFCIMLYESYLNKDKGETCPRPKILLNDDILKFQSEQQREIYEKVGAVGVDATLEQTPERLKHNVKMMKTLMKGFVQDKNHIFVFPSGRFCVLTNLPEKAKMQVGTAALITRALKSKKRVKVVPLGFCYSKKVQKVKLEDDSKEKRTLGSIYIGEPVYFERDGGEIYTTVGNATPDKATPDFQHFFWDRQLKQDPNILLKAFQKKKPLVDDDFLPEENTVNPFVIRESGPMRRILSHGEPVEGDELKYYVNGILAENLDICKQEATAQLPKQTLGTAVNYH